VLKTSVGATVWTEDNITDETGALEVDLAASDGASLIGYDDTTVYAQLQAVSSRVLSALEVGLDNTGLTNNVSAFNDAITWLKSNGSGVFYFPPGTYLFNSSLQVAAAEGIHIVGAGIGATIFKRASHFEAYALRFYGGYNNSIRHLTWDCDGYNGGGPRLLDIRSRIDSVAVLNCPDRPFSMNGGGNSSYGIDDAGLTSDDGGFTGATFYPAECSITNCFAYNAGRTAYSQKRMRKSLIAYNRIETCYSEGITIDGRSDNANIIGNWLVDVARTDGATAFPNKGGSLYLATGGGGVGGIGIDAAYGSVVKENHIVGVQTDVATINNRSLAAVNFINNIAASFGCDVTGNWIEDAKVGILCITGTGGSNFKHTLERNKFKTTGTAAGSGSAQYGDIWLGSGNTGISATKNRHVDGNLLITDETGNNVIETESVVVTSALVTFGGGNTGITYSTNTIRQERQGRYAFFDVRIVFTNKGSSTGSLLISGLEWEADTNSISVVNVAIENASTAPDQPYAEVQPDAKTIKIYNDRSITGTRTELTDATFSNTSIIRISGRYAI